MDALQMYLSSDSDSEANTVAVSKRKRARSPQPQHSDIGLPERCSRQQEERSAGNCGSASPPRLPSPPKDLLKGNDQSLQTHGLRVRSFPHVDGNFALHVYIPVVLSIVAKSKLTPILKKASNLVPQLQSMEDEAVSLAHTTGNKSSYMDGIKLAKEYHISLSRTVPIRIYQIDSIVSMLRHKLYNQKRYMIEFGKWEVFVNDERTRSFLALEIVHGGFPEIQHQVCLVNDVYKLHDLPLYYKNARPHISVAWALGDGTDAMRRAAEELNRFCGVTENSQTVLCSFTFSKVLCKVGQQVYPIWTRVTQPSIVQS